MTKTFLCLGKKNMRSDLRLLGRGIGYRMLTVAGLVPGTELSKLMDDLKDT